MTNSNHSAFPATSIVWRERESRQARRARERREAEAAAAPLLGDYDRWLMCRSEDDDGHGGWAVIGVSDAVEGDGVAAAFQRLAAPLFTRCELIEATEEAFVRWSKRVGLRRSARVRS